MASRFLPLFICILSLIHCTDASLHLDVSPSNISPGLSSSLNITCTFYYQSSSNVSNILSLILAKDVAHPEEAKRYLELASLSVFDADHVIQLTQKEASALGHIGERDDSYLSLQWTNPSQRDSGVYRCEARGMDKTGHCLSFSQTAQVSSTQPHVDDLIRMVQGLQTNFQHYTESSSLLYEALENMANNQNESFSSLLLDVAELVNRQRNVDLAAVSYVAHLQFQRTVLTDLHNKSLLPRTCKDVVSDDPRTVVVLSDGLEVLCDTKTDEGGWLIIQRRVTGEMDFFRTWEDYKYGFGDINGEFWFGNEKIHRLTNLRRYELRVDFNFSGQAFYATYSRFRLFGEPEKYKLEATGYSGNAGDSLARHNNQMFSTKDRDNNNNNCATTYHGAWWYEKCHFSNLNGLWGSVEYAKGLTWHTTTGYYDTATFTEMKIRPVN